ncbi:MAG: hypothetical protein IJ128_04165 [Firmicutes bacterium]|nr:hypothetical protein [Bacillota bacterium]
MSKDRNGRRLQGPAGGRLDVSADRKKEENKKRAMKMTVIFGIVALVLVLAMMVEVYL